MSAFLVSAATIDVILTQLQLRDGETLARLFLPFTAPDDPRDRLDDLGAQLLALNGEALRQRYGDPGAIPHYTFTARPETAGYATRQLDCYLYQCSEGDVPEQPLFEALKAMRVLLVDRVLANVPAYARAPWGVR